MSRFLFILLLLAVAIVYAIGKGWLGTAPYEADRQPQRALQQMHPEKITLGAPALPSR